MKIKYDDLSEESKKKVDSNKYIINRKIGMYFFI